ncbi:Structural maintenance of chromosomes protein 3 [Durusdinium trenchii]|uniref:Structural maintenance of chromosomes protein n=1 Tax=Durusdinium trenchii TaxID=1381693 RepID=A0ABP0S046_9DINO
MHIKELEIQGFKSYKEQAGVEEFSPGANCVVGRNGSGKSNFFRAIQFVLGERSFSQLNHKERTELLHEGAGAGVMTAHVQIVFDNADRRFMMDSDEVVLRRTIGLKKDEYFLNNKHVTKSDVVNLLESAGFSRSNPYYIVQQGKVNALCLMKDEHRLDLLKEVAGTTVYEERRKNSENILAETKLKREKIQDAVQYIEQRLDELKGEKEELEAFRSLDRRRRALQYTLFDRELNSASDTLETLDQDRAEEVEDSADKGRQLAEVREQTESQHDELKTLQRTLKRSEQEAKVMDDACGKLVKTKAAWEIKYKDLVEREKALTEQAELFQSELASIETRLAEMEQSLASESLPALEQANKQHETARVELRNAERRQRDLEAKRGRKSQFSSQAERDSFLATEIRNVEEAIKEKRDTQATLERDTQEQEATSDKLAREVEELRQELSEHDQRLQVTTKELGSLNRERNEADEKRKGLWSAAAKSTREKEDAEHHYDKLRKNLKRSLPAHVAQGLDAVDRIAAELGLEKGKQIFGPLFELILPVDETFEVALDVAAGKSLTHIVVDTDETAAKLMEELRRQNAGRATFKPLNQLARRRRENARGRNTEDLEHDIQGLDPADTDAIPLISKVKYPPAVKDAVRLVLGKVLLCRDGQIASQRRKQLKVNCVTLDGEELNRRGALTGGHYDPRQNKFRAAAQIRQVQETFDRLTVEETKARAEMGRVDQVVTQLRGRISKIEENQKQLHDMRDQIRADLALKEKELKAHRQTQVETSKLLQTCVQGLKDLEDRRASFETELKTPMQERLSSAEQQELKTLVGVIRELRDKAAQAAEAVEEAHRKVVEMENELEQNLARRKEELLEYTGKGSAAPKARKAARRKRGKGKGKAAPPRRRGRTSRRQVEEDLYDDEEEEEEEDDDEDDDDELMADVEGQKSGSNRDATEAVNNLEWIANAKEEAKRELDTAEERLSSARAQHAEMERAVMETRNAIKEVEAEIERLAAEEAELTTDLQRAEEKLEKLLTRRASALEKREESARKIRELGSIPTDELAKVNVRRSVKKLEDEIKSVNKELRKYSHVNKKALDQFISFSDRRETLLKRKQELDDGEKSITDLIRHLDQQKDEDILRTFRGVAKNFREVFKELVPAGVGELVMVTRSTAAPSEPEDGEEDDLMMAASSSTSADYQVDEFVGISPRVTFAGDGQAFQMRQLSGGQRALVALTLIFAIQRCDPAPFYLFDEIDQALDQNHRAAVAAMITRQSETAQFIVTTFRPELVKSADKCFGIQFQNKVSSMVELPAQEALQFVETIASSEQQQTGAHRKQGSRATRKRKSAGESSDEEEEGDHDLAASSSDSGGDGNPAESPARARANPSARRRRIRA